MDVPNSKIRHTDRSERSKVKRNKKRHKKRQKYFMSEGIKKKHTNESNKEAIEVLENKQSPLQLLTPTNIMNEPSALQG